MINVWRGSRLVQGRRLVGAAALACFLVSISFAQGGGGLDQPPAPDSQPGEDRANGMVDGKDSSEQSNGGSGSDGLDRPTLDHPTPDHPTPDHPTPDHPIMDEGSQADTHDNPNAFERFVSVLADAIRPFKPAMFGVSLLLMLALGAVWAVRLKSWLSAVDESRVKTSFVLAFCLTLSVLAPAYGLHQMIVSRDSLEFRSWEWHIYDFIQYLICFYYLFGSLLLPWHSWES